MIDHMRLKEIEKRANAAKDGPWSFSIDKSEPGDCGTIESAEHEEWEGRVIPVCDFGAISGPYQAAGWAPQSADLIFILNAREDVVDLVGEVKRLRSKQQDILLRVTATLTEMQRTYGHAASCPRYIEAYQDDPCQCWHGDATDLIQKLLSPS